MSSLAAARADNFYFPPEWRPEFGGISKFAGSKGANQYEQYGIIRFELPFDGWCLGCNRHMSKGLRFNAKKDKAGKYHTTTIWSFSMKCFSCEQRFVIKTNPQENTYDFAEGLRKMEQDYTPDEDDGVIDISSMTDEKRMEMEANPILKLEYDFEGKVKELTNQERLSKLVELKKEHGLADYDSNARLRANNRKRKKLAANRDEAGRQMGLSIPLLDEDTNDSIQAQSILFHKVSSNSNAKISHRLKESSIIGQSIFSTGTSGLNKSGNVVRQGVTNVALKKQAVAAINVKQFVVTEPVAKSHIHSSVNSASNIAIVHNHSKVSATRPTETTGPIMRRTAGRSKKAKRFHPLSDGDGAALSELFPPKSSNALALLASYSDSE